MGGSGGGSSGSGGGSTTSNTYNQTKSWAEYVPPETYAAYKKVMPKLGAKYDVGLTPEEKSYYSGQAIGDVDKQFAGASKSLNDQLARSGISGRSGAALEAFNDLNRSRAVAGASAYGGMTGLDLQKKNENLQNIMKGISLPGSPIQVGSTTQTQYSPARGGGGGGS